MWYTTSFDWKLLFDKDITVKQAKILNWIEDLSQDEKRMLDMPDWYCQWVVSLDWDWIIWDWWEKFYYYVERLEAIIDTYMKPWWINLNWQLRWSWNEVSDTWIITVKNNEIKVQELWVPEWVCPHCWESLE